MRVFRRHITLFFASCLFVLVSLLGAPDSALAQTNWWAPLDGPYGGASVADLERLPDGSVLAATANGVFRSVDEGLTWTSRSAGLTGFDVRDVLLSRDGSIFSAVFGRGVFRWESSREEWVAQGLANRFVTSLIEPTDDVIVAGVNGSVFRSNDGGTSWQSYTLDGFNVHVQSFSANADFLFAGTDLGVFRSMDLGMSWEFASVGLQEYDIKTLATNAEGHVFAGAEPSSGGCTLYRSRGNGNLWTCVQPATDPLLVPMLKVTEDGTLYAGGYRHLFRTGDEGTTWLTRQAGGSSVQTILLLGNTMLIGTRGEGILRSQNAGVTWETANTGLSSSITAVRTLNDGRLIVGTEGGLFESSDLGMTWQRVEANAPLIQVITDVALDENDRMVAATHAGVWRHEAGSGWTAIGPPGLPAIRDIHVAEDGTILAGYYAGVWLRSGTSWVNSPITGSDGAPRDVSSVWQTESGALIAGASWDSWRRAPGQTSWSLMNTDQLPWFDVQSINERDGRLLAGTRFSGVLQSYDDGQSWYPAGTGLSGSEDIQDVQFDAVGTPYIATYGSGVFQLNPWTRQWLPVRSGMMAHQRVTSMAFDIYNNAYAGTVDGGVFAHIVRGVSTEGAVDLPQALELASVYPNPTSGGTQAHIHAASAGQVHVIVVDMLGRRVLERREWVPAGESVLDLNLSSLSAGSYLISIESNGVRATRPLTRVR